MKHHEPPWHSVPTILEALAMVEAVARERGWRELRRPMWDESRIEDAERRLGFALPDEPKALARWYDPSCWGWFQVNPENDDLAADPTNQSEQVIRVHDLDEWRADEKDPPTNEDLCIREFVAEHCGKGRSFPREWRECRYLRFGSTIWFESLLVCIGGPEEAVGRVGITVMDDPQVLFPARSLRRWLAMLAHTGLNDLVLTSPPRELLDSDDGAAAVEEFNRLNPHCDRYR